MTFCGGQRDAPEDVELKENYRRDAGPSTAACGYARTPVGCSRKNVWLGFRNPYRAPQFGQIANRVRTLRNLTPGCSSMSLRVSSLHASSASFRPYEPTVFPQVTHEKDPAAQRNRRLSSACDTKSAGIQSGIKSMNAITNAATPSVASNVEPRCRASACITDDNLWRPTRRAEERGISIS